MRLLAHPLGREPNERQQRDGTAPHPRLRRLLRAGPVGRRAATVADLARVTLASAISTDVTRRLGQAEQEATAPADEPQPARRDRLLRRLRAIFGPGFVAVPVFTAATAADLDAGRRSPALLAGDPLVPYTLVTRMERVRPALARMTMPLRLAEVLGTGPGLELEVAHVPHAGERPWIGLTLADDGTGVKPDGLVSVVLQGAADLDLGVPLAGLLVDEWTEVVPSRTETVRGRHRDAAVRSQPPPVPNDAPERRRARRLKPSRPAFMSA